MTRALLSIQAFQWFHVYIPQGNHDPNTNAKGIIGHLQGHTTGGGWQQLSWWWSCDQIAMHGRWWCSAAFVDMSVGLWTYCLENVKILKMQVHWVRMNSTSPGPGANLNPGAYPALAVSRGKVKESCRFFPFPSQLWPSLSPSVTWFFLIFHTTFLLEGALSPLFPVGYATVNMPQNICHLLLTIS